MMLRAIIAAAALSAAAVPAVAQDPAAGERAYAACRACHRVGEGARNTVGPALNGIFGQPAASVAGFAYSDALKDAGLTWDEATLAEYLKNPKGKVPGTKMVFNGVKQAGQLADLVAYLKQATQ